MLPSQDWQLAPCGLVRVDAWGYVAFANERFGAMLGRPPAALAGLPFQSLLSSPSRVVFEVNIVPVLQLAGSFDGARVALLHASGRQVDVLLNVRAGPDAGWLEGACVPAP